MVALTLIYFDFDGGRGEPARLAMIIGGVAFEDKRVNFSEWTAMRENMPLRALPVLEVDRKFTLTQCNTINRYVAKLADLYPRDDWQATLADEVMDICEDIGTQLGNTIQLEEAAKKKARTDLTANALPRFLEHLDMRLQAAGGEWFADGRLTVADLKVFQLIRWLTSGALDHVPTDLPSQFGPSLLKHLERIQSHSKVQAYYAARKK